MMNILVITPLYYIEGRPQLFHDTSAIHYLIRPWAEKHKVLVLDIYFESLRKIMRYASAEERRFRKGYSYTVDGVPVALIEVMKPYKQGSRITDHEKKRVKSFIEKVTAERAFDPDIIVAHLPTTVINVVKEIFPNIRKMAVLHTTDRQNWYRRTSETAAVRQTFDAFYARSEDLRFFFEQQQLSGLSAEIIYSGGKKAAHALERTDHNIGIMYAGKLIPRKHVDVIIEALATIRDRYAFHLEIYGDGVERSRLEQLAEDRLYPGSYSFMGMVDHEAVLSAMTKNDFFVMVSEDESFGLTYVEAMVNGCIPIGSVGEGIDGIIQHGVNGYLTRANSITGLAEQFEECFRLQGEEKERLLVRMEESASKYSEESAGMHYLEIIEKEYEMTSREERSGHAES